MCKKRRLLLAFVFFVVLGLVSVYATSESMADDLTPLTMARKLMDEREGEKFQTLLEYVDATEERKGINSSEVLECVAETEGTEYEVGDAEEVYAGGSNEKSNVVSQIFAWLAAAGKLFLKLVALFFAWLGSMIFSGSPLKVWTAIILTLLTVAFIQFAGLCGGAESFYAKQRKRDAWNKARNLDETSEYWNLDVELGAICRGTFVFVFILLAVYLQPACVWAFRYVVTISAVWAWGVCVALPYELLTDDEFRYKVLGQESALEPDGDDYWWRILVFYSVLGATSVGLALLSPDLTKYVSFIAPYVSYKAIACCATIMALSPLFPQAFKLLPFPDEIIPIDTMDIDGVQALVQLTLFRLGIAISTAIIWS